MNGVFIVNFVIIFGVLAVVCIAIRWIVLSVNRAIKALRETARGVADVADRMERLEKKLGEREQAKP